jgi:HSP20 family protein
MSSWEPYSDVYLHENRLVINIELAGMRRDDLELAIDGNQLIVSGQRPDCGRPMGCSFLVMEIRYGYFSCTFELPPGYNLGDAVAAYQNGFLRVEIPKSARSQPKKQRLPLTGEL